MLLSKAKKIPVPHEEGTWFEIRALSWVQMEEARKAASADQREIMKDLGPEFLSALGSSDESESDAALKALERQKYNISNYSTGLLLQFGIVDWNYEEDGESIAVTDETLAKLDEATAMWAAQAVIDITKPSEEEGKDD